MALSYKPDSPITFMRMVDRVEQRKRAQRQIDALEELGRQGTALSGLVRDISVQLEPVTVEAEREVRNRLIDSVIVARSLAEAVVTGNRRAAGEVAQLDAILRDVLAVAFGVKVQLPATFIPGFVCVDAVVPTEDPNEDGQIVRVVSPGFIQERDDGPPITIRPAHVVVHSFLQPARSEEVCDG